MSGGAERFSGSRLWPGWFQRPRCRALSGPEAWLGSRVARRAAGLKKAEREESDVKLQDSVKTERLRGLDSCA